MLTIFSIPKAFKGHIGIIQRNAIASWTLLRPRPEIILFGDDEGTTEAARDLGVLHAPNVARNEFGTPLLNDFFHKAEERASHPILTYVNADIILLDDFPNAVARVRQWRPRFLMVGQRWDVDVHEALDFDVPSWQEALRQFAWNTGRQRSHWWTDYFAFSKGLGVNLPPFAIGRTAWDNWLIWHARVMGLAVVDASEFVVAIHQNHDYGHHPGGEKGAYTGEESARNRALAGGWWRHYTIGDATHRLTADQITPSLGRWWVKANRAASELMRPVWFSFLDFTRPLRHRLGLRKKVAPC